MDSRQTVQIGRHVLEMEADALKDLAKSLGDEYIQAVEKIYQTKGRVIVSGMGKSGHVGQKIASTFASVGTPAFFVWVAHVTHPSRKDCQPHADQQARKPHLHDHHVLFHGALDVGLQRRPCP